MYPGAQLACWLNGDSQFRVGISAPLTLSRNTGIGIPRGGVPIETLAPVLETTEIKHSRCQLVCWEEREV